MRISLLSRAHCGVLAALHRQCFADAWDSAAFARLLEHPGAAAYLAETDTAPGGLALVRTAGGEAEILTIGVVPAQRRNGMARALLGALIADARRRGADALFLEVAESNLAAQALYRSAGFAEVGRRPNYYRSLHGSEAARVLALALAER